MRALIIALTMLICPVSYSAQLGFPVLPGGAMVYKKVESIRERRFSNLIEQKTDFSCGAASLATILYQGYRFDIDEQTVIEGMLQQADHDLVRSQGFSMLDMKRYVEAIGLRARGYRIPAEQLEQVKVPAVVLIDVRGYKHFVVLQKTEGNWVYIGDPVLGHKRYTLEDFKAGWNGILFAVIGAGYDRDNPLTAPPLPLTAKNRLDRFKPVNDAELMEFGFIQSDFF